MIGPQTNPSDTPREPDVIVAIDDLRRSRQDLLEAAQTLRERLSATLSEEPEQSFGTLSRVGSCPLSRAIYEEAGAVREVVTMLHGILQRLEI